MRFIYHKLVMFEQNEEQMDYDVADRLHDRLVAAALRGVCKRWAREELASSPLTPHAHHTRRAPLELWSTNGAR